MIIYRITHLGTDFERPIHLPPGNFFSFFLYQLHSIACYQAPRCSLKARITQKSSTNQRSLCEGPTWHTKVGEKDEFRGRGNSTEAQINK